MAGYMFTILQTTDITPCAKKEKILVSLKLRTPPISCHKRKEYYPEIIYNKQKNVYPTKSRHQELAAYEHCSVSQANIGGIPRGHVNFSWVGEAKSGSNGCLGVGAEDEATKPEGPGGDCHHTIADGGPLG